MSMEQVKLPEKMSELIRVALVDLVKVEESPDYIVRMENWHKPRDGVCEVCLAGAVIAKTLKAPSNENCLPSGTSRSIRDKLEALNELRTGEVCEAAYVMGIYDVGAEYDTPIIDYNDDPQQFKRDMLQLAKDLEAGGL